MKLQALRFSLVYIFVAAIMTIAEKYDVIFIGSGPGALVAAEYLTRNPNTKVLMLEAGLPSLQESGGKDVLEYSATKGFTKFDIPGEYFNTIYNPVNEKYRIDWINGPYMWLGKVVGGCSSIHAALYFRTPDSYVTDMKWPFSPERVTRGYDENEQFFGHTDIPSPDGKHYLQEGYNIVARGLKNLGYQEKKKLNEEQARNHKCKTYGHPPFTFKNGLRDSPAKSFLGIMKNRSNFKLISSAMVNYIIQYKGKATGIVYNDHIYVFLTSRGAIAMGAGALNTPKILIQSGIGPQDQLNILYNRKDFPGVRQNGTNGWILNENVGKNLLDTNVVFAVFQHPEMKSFQPRNRPQGAIDQYMNQDQTGPWANSGPVMIAYENYTVNNRMYQFQLTVIPSDFGEFAQYSNIFTTSLYVNNPEARDYASFSLDGKWWGITKNKIYLSSPNDLAAMQSYAKRIIDTITSTGATFLSASKGQTVEEWVSSHRNWITHHFAGTCYTSSDSHDVTKCADEKFRVIGTTNVFVADGSLMKEGTVNPYGFIMYIGREAGNLLEEYLNE